MKNNIASFLEFLHPSLFSFCAPYLFSFSESQFFDAPRHRLWSINHLYLGLSVPACSKRKQQPLDHCRHSFQVFCQPPPSKPYTHLTIEHCSGATYTFRTIWFVFRQSTDKALLMLIKDDVSEIYSTYAKNRFNVGCIRQMPFAKQTLFEKTLSIPLPFFPLCHFYSLHINKLHFKL